MKRKHRHPRAMLDHPRVAVEINRGLRVLSLLFFPDEAMEFRKVQNR
jgi:hypothetical protein